MYSLTRPFALVFRTMRRRHRKFKQDSCLRSVDCTVHDKIMQLLYSMCARVVMPHVIDHTYSFLILHLHAKHEKRADTSILKIL